jgi:hypothetical protein
MKISEIISIMEKTGSMVFDSEKEKVAFSDITTEMFAPYLTKQAQGEMGMPPAMAQGMAQGMPQAMPPMPPMPEQAPAPSPMPAGPDTTAVVGESITNSDIETLVKVINILTSLKANYDQMKKEQMAMIQQQASGTPAQ